MALVTEQLNTTLSKIGASSDSNLITDKLDTIIITLGGSVSGKDNLITKKLDVINELIGSGGGGSSTALLKDVKNNVTIEIKGVE